MVKGSDQQGKPNLAATSWALMGMLSYEYELSGYDIRKWIDWSMRFFYGSPAYSQIYSELKKLEQLGFVTSRVENGAGNEVMAIDATIDDECRGDDRGVASVAGQGLCMQGDFQRTRNVEDVDGGGIVAPLPFRNERIDTLIDDFRMPTSPDHCDARRLSGD